MNRITRLVANYLNRPTLCLLASWLAKSPTPYLPRVARNHSTLGSAAVLFAAGYLFFAFCGVRALVSVWILAEVVFLVANLYRMHCFNRLETPPEYDADVLSIQVDKLMRSIQKLDFLHHFDGWLISEDQRSFVSLPRDNILDILSYTFGYRRRDGLEDYDRLLDALVRKLEVGTGIRFPQGYDHRVRFREHLWEDIRMMHYPLVFYASLEATSQSRSLEPKMVWLVGMANGWLMSWLGYASEVYRDRNYFVYGSLRRGCRPIVFIHGIGMGLIMYLPLLRQLTRVGRPIITMELRHLSLRPCFETPSVDDVANFIVKILDAYQIDKGIIVAHSYGTLIASRMNALYSDRIIGMCLMDPVCCVMHHPKLLTTFIYRDMPLPSIFAWLVDRALGLISHDPSIAVSVCRDFKWTQLNLWPEDVSKKTILVLSERDALVPVQEVKIVFANTEAEVIVHPTHTHGSFLADIPFQEKIMRCIDRMMKDEEATSEGTRLSTSQPTTILKPE